jgi:hypothetical protein
LDKPGSFFELEKPSAAGAVKARSESKAFFLRVYFLG